jgi:hypothetical protein
MTTGRSEQDLDRREEADDLQPPMPASGKGIPMTVEETPEGVVVHARASGILSDGKILKMLVGGFLGVGVGLFVAGGAVIGSLREPGLGSILPILLGGGMGCFIAWLGLIAIRWAVIAGRCTTTLTIAPDVLSILRVGPFGAEERIQSIDYQTSMVTDQFQTIYELIATVKGPRVVLVLSGRSVAELQWLQHLIGSRLTIGRYR